MSNGNEHVILVAFTVANTTRVISRDEAEVFLRERLPLPHGSLNDGDPHLKEWWIAEDQRDDGSDNDSAVFVPKGSQAAAETLLRTQLYERYEWGR